MTETQARASVNNSYALVRPELPNSTQGLPYDIRKDILITVINTCIWITPSCKAKLFRKPVGGRLEWPMAVDTTSPLHVIGEGQMSH
jgi:hypothetical protein